MKLTLLRRKKQDTIQDKLNNTLQEKLDAMQHTLGTMQASLGMVQDRLNDTLQDKLSTVQDTFGTVQEKLGDTLQDTLGTVQGKVNDTVQERICTPAEARAAARQPHNWGADVATGVAALLLAGLFVGLTRNTSSHRQSRDGGPGGSTGRVDPVGPTGVYPASSMNSATPLDAEAKGMADWGHTSGTVH